MIETHSIFLALSGQSVDSKKTVIKELEGNNLRISRRIIVLLQGVVTVARRLSENSFSSITQSLGKRAFPDSLLVNYTIVTAK